MKWDMVIRIVTDSTASIPAETAQALGITIVPLIVIFGDEAYLDGKGRDWWHQQFRPLLP